MLRMTDGVQDVQGMEYQPIKCLNTSLTPGIKVIIHTRNIVMEHDVTFSIRSNAL